MCVWFPCWPHTWESSTCVTCPSCPGGVPARAGWAELSCVSPQHWRNGERSALGLSGKWGCLEVATAEVWNSTRGWRAQKCPCTLPCELPGASPLPGDAQPRPPLLRSCTGAEQRPRVWEHRDPHRVWGSLQRAGVVLLVMGQVPTGLGIQRAPAAGAALGCSTLMLVGVLWRQGFVGPQLGLCWLCLCALSPSGPCGRSCRRALWPGRAGRRQQHPQQHPQLFKAWNAWSWGLGQALPPASGGPRWVPWLCSGSGCCGGSSLLGLCARGMSGLACSPGNPHAPVLPYPRNLLAPEAAPVQGSIVPGHSP